MKLQNLSVIFIIIIVPILLITSYYISLQVDTLNMQTTYNTKLAESTKAAIEAFEINTVEWNNNYSTVSDSKRRDAMASINTFTTSLANNLGVGGTSKEYLLSHIPAIAYTLYDGYYIYTPADSRITLTDKDGKTAFYKEEYKNADLSSAEQRIVTSKTDIPEDAILYRVAEPTKAQGTYQYNYIDKDGIKQKSVEENFTTIPTDAASEYKHILKPFTAYSEKISVNKDGSTKNFVVNYTLDNYIRIYGTVTNLEGYDEFISKSGYLIKKGRIALPTTETTIYGIKYDGGEILPENLSEQIAYKNNDAEIDYTIGIFNYVYEADRNTKVYYDPVKEDFFQLNTKGTKVYVSTLTEPLYKKCVIPKQIGSNTTYMELYQKIAATIENSVWYMKDSDTYIKIDDETKLKTYLNTSADTLNEIYEETRINDYSAVNYCVESCIFSENIKSLLGDFLDDNGDKPFDFDNVDPENPDSIFSGRKREVIKQTLENDLSQSIVSYSKQSAEYPYQMPNLLETDWDQLLNNVSMITFLQGMPIGTKYYNSYSIVTSTNNKEYVDPEEIYFSVLGDTAEDQYYHRKYCNKAKSTNGYIGYRNIDYVQRSYKTTVTGTESTKYYYAHDNCINANNKNSELGCYSCMVDVSKYDTDNSKITEQAYNTALARERYIARMTELPEKLEPIYFLNVETGTLEAGTFKNIGATPKIIQKGTSSSSIELSTKTVKLTRKLFNDYNYYEISAINVGNELPDTQISNAFGSVDVGEPTVNHVEAYSDVKSDNKINVEIKEFDTEKMQFEVSGLNGTIGGRTWMGDWLYS